jgi:hypothetical protein
MAAFFYCLTMLLVPGLSGAAERTARAIDYFGVSLLPLDTPYTARLHLEIGDAPLQATTTDAVRQGLREGQFPWYDSGADRVRPVWAPRRSWMNWLRERFDRVLDAIGRFFKSLGLNFAPGGGATGLRSDWLGTILLGTVLAAFFVFLLVIWLRREPFAAGAGAATARLGSAHLLAQLPGDFSAGLDDPWAEAQRRRLAGDYAGAIIYLFAHQLISLDRAGLIRLAPGWTGRQYVRWLRDPVLVDSLGATLGLFEEIYYGHRLPSQGAFEHAWGRAQALEDRRNALERSR